jgi:hypothetical protein
MKGPGAVRDNVRKCSWGIVLALCFILICACLPRPVLADGGAPNLAYVSGTVSGISVINVGQGKVTKTITLAGDPAMILLSPDGRWLYTTQPALGQVSVIAAKTGQALCKFRLPGHPTVLALSPDATVLYAGGEGAGSVAALNPATCQVQRTYRTDGSVYGLWVTTSGTAGSTSGKLWVTGPTSLSVFDVRGPLLKTLPIDGGPQFLCIPSGVTAYVTTRQGSVDAIDIQTWTVRQVLTGGIYGSMDYNALTLEVYVPDEQHNVIDVLAAPATGAAASSQKPEWVLHTLAHPNSIAITNDGLFGFVALEGGKVTMVDLIDRDPVYTLSVGGTPHFVITGLFPPSVAISPPPAPQQSIPLWKQALIAIPTLLIAASLVVLLLVLLRPRKPLSHDKQ